MYRVVSFEDDEQCCCERTLFRSKILEDCFGFIDKRKAQGTRTAAKQMCVLDPFDRVMTRRPNRAKKSVDSMARLVYHSRTLQT